MPLAVATTLHFCPFTPYMTTLPLRLYHAHTSSALQHTYTISALQLADTLFSTPSLAGALFNKDEKHSTLQELVLRKELPFHWRPWDSPNCSSPYPHWVIFYWAVCHTHVPLLQIWKKAASEREARSSRKWLWETDGGRLICSACSNGNVCQVEMLLEGSSSRPADALSNALVYAASLGHLLILERLIRENADINAWATKASGHGMTPMQAAAEGGHLAVVERLQEGANVNDMAFRGEGTALQFADRGGHLAVVARLCEADSSRYHFLTPYSGNIIHVTSPTHDFTQLFLTGGTYAHVLV